LAKSSHANRGKTFEALIDKSNEAYDFQEIALINKIPNDFIVQRDWKTGQIIKAFPGKKSTVDYVGIAWGCPISFEAKSTKNKTSFPISNIKEHQIEFLSKWKFHKGIAFYLINFSTFDRTFLLFNDQLEEEFLKNGLKSIPFSFFEQNCIEVFSASLIPIDYLQALKGRFT
jgi:recombination protein U